LRGGGRVIPDTDSDSDTKRGENVTSKTEPPRLRSGKEFRGRENTLASKSFRNFKNVLVEGSEPGSGVQVNRNGNDPYRVMRESGKILVSLTTVKEAGEVSQRGERNYLPNKEWRVRMSLGERGRKGIDQEVYQADQFHQS